MRVIREAKALQSITEYYRTSGQTIGFVPTMGFLHEGHTSLINSARRDSDIVIVSVFVNPTQFGPNEDLEKYPQDFLRDYEICNRAGVDYIFSPGREEIYPKNYNTYVEVQELSQKLEGYYRYGHFQGVCTVVLKLFNIVKPHISYFGKKDAQQAIILRKMVQDLNLEIEIKFCETIREVNGLAKSSRNVYLTPEQRDEAAVLYKALLEGQRLILEKSVIKGPDLEKILTEIIETGSRNSRLQYIAVTDTKNLETIADLTRFRGEILISLACFYGETRLIDNIFVTV